MESLVWESLGVLQVPEVKERFVPLHVHGVHFGDTIFVDSLTRNSRVTNVVSQAEGAVGIFRDMINAGERYNIIVENPDRPESLTIEVQVGESDVTLDLDEIDKLQSQGAQPQFEVNVMDALNGNEGDGKYDGIVEWDRKLREGYSKTPHPKSAFGIGQE